MKKKGMKKVLLLFTILVMLLLQSSLASAQSQKEYHPQGLFFNLQFVFNVISSNGTAEPISPGETREVNLTLAYGVAGGAFGRLLLKLLEGKSFPIQLSVEDKPDWCEAWMFPENMTGFIPYEGWRVQNFSLFIHINDEAPSNYTNGYIKFRVTTDAMKGPFNIITLIQGFEQQCTITFVTSP